MPDALTEEQGTERISQPMSRQEALTLAREGAARKRLLDKQQADELRAQGIEPDLGKRPSAGREVDTPMKAIRAMCLDCVCGSYREVELCPAPDCPLWAMRFGMRPETAEAEGKLTDRTKFTKAVRGLEGTK